MKQCSQKQFNFMAVSMGKRLQEKTGESRRKCFFWATSTLLSEYEIVQTQKEVKQSQVSLFGN